MENTPLNNTTIEIIEEAGRSKTQYGISLKLKGKDIETGKTNTYTIYDTTSKGEISKAWAAYNNGALLGQTVAIGYATKDGTLQDGTPYTQRIIRAIDLDIGNGMKNASSQAKKPLYNAPRASGEVLKDDAFWEKQAYEKCCSLWAAAHIERDGIDLAQKAVTEGKYWDLFQAIKKDGEKRFSPLRQAVAKHAPEVVSPDIQEMADEMANEDFDDIANLVPF